MPGTNDNDLVLDEPKDTPNEGLEAEADATDTDSEDAEVGTESEGAAEGDGAESSEEEQVERKPSRGEIRFQTLSKAAREAKEEAARARQELEETRARLARLEQPAQRSQEKTREELALMTPDELIDYRLGLASKNFEAKLGQIQWASYESADKAAFQALASRDPVAARYADEVEQRLTTMRQQGQNVDRERLLTFIVGEKVRQRGGAAKEKQNGDGKKRIARQTVAAGTAKGDTPSNRGRMSEQEAREKRLENFTL